jgi:hypothetical protein
MDEAVDRDRVLQNYLRNLQEKAAANRKVNIAGANALSRAKLCAVIAPLTALACGLIAALFS